MQPSGNLPVQYSQKAWGDPSPLALSCTPGYLPEKEGARSER